MNVEYTLTTFLSMGCNPTFVRLPPGSYAMAGEGAEAGFDRQAAVHVGRALVHDE